MKQVMTRVLSQVPVLDELPRDVRAMLSGGIGRFLADVVFGEHATVTFWGGSGAAFGFSFSPSITSLTGNDKITVGYNWYEQIKPCDKSGNDINVEF